MEKDINEEEINKKEISPDERDSNNISKENWLNEHGSPDYSYLKHLAARGTPEAEDELRQIASDMDIENYENIPVPELMEKIRLADNVYEDDENRHVRS